MLGRWEIGNPGFIIEVAPAHGRLVVRMPPPGWSSELRYQGNGRFTALSAPEVRYPLVGDDRVDALTIGMSDMHWDARRLDGAAPAR